jgi:hypothetical protein
MSRYQHLIRRMLYHMHRTGKLASYLPNQQREQEKSREDLMNFPAFRLRQRRPARLSDYLPARLDAAQQNSCHPHKQVLQPALQVLRSASQEEQLVVRRRQLVPRSGSRSRMVAAEGSWPEDIFRLHLTTRRRTR